MMSRRFYFLLCLFSLNWPSAQALEFSATAVMSTPGRADVSTQLYYSQGRLRKEFFYYGEPVIQIQDTLQKVSLMCFTDQQLCYENQMLENFSIGIESAIESPCDSTDHLKCENLGEEELNQRKAIRWKITSLQDDQELVSSLWLDAELKIPVKQTLFNGATVNLIWIDSETLNSRPTEKWLEQITLPDGRKQESFQWYDKELKISIRQTFANGNTQEFKHIVVEKLPDKLFTMPVGYEKRLTGKPAPVSEKTQNIQ